MSMLTPPGMGGEYRIKGDRYPRMRPRPRSRLKIAVGAVSMVAALGLAGWGTFQLIDVFTGGADTVRAAGDGEETCTAQDREPGQTTSTGSGDTEAAEDNKAEKAGKNLPEPGQITVNVLNATPRTGLAAKTAKKLEKRGFEIGEVANAPEALDKKVEASGLLMGATGKEAVNRLKVLGTQLEGAKTRYDERTGEAVDLVLGNDFEKLAKEKAATESLTALTAPSPSPSANC